jgi:hypothetical protein
MFIYYMWDFVYFLKSRELNSKINHAIFMFLFVLQRLVIIFLQII